jgi:hypothetical protein
MDEKELDRELEAIRTKRLAEMWNEYKSKGKTPEYHPIPNGVHVLRKLVLVDGGAKLV